MTRGAPRVLPRVWLRRARGAGRALVLVAGAVCAMAVPGSASDITEARFAAPTDRYPHAVLGDGLEWGALELLGPGTRIRLTLPENRVFEDLAPRLADVDGDGDREAIVVESHANLGARLAIYDMRGVVAATPFIGRRFRWLAPVAWEDLDGDGRVELAYVDRPHLARILRVWRLEDGALRQVVSLDGLTNHRIGEDFISGGVRDCGDGPEMVLAEAGWQGLFAVRLQGDRLRTRPIPGLPATPDGFAAALRCAGTP